MPIGDTVSTVLSLIRQAIRNKLSLALEYDGFVRFVSPHAIGYKNLTRIMLVCYQYEGETSKGSVPYGSNHHKNWRCFDVSKIHSVRIIENIWHTADNHSSRSTAIDSIIEEVD